MMDIAIDKIICLAPFVSFQLRQGQYSTCCTSVHEYDFTDIEKASNSFLFRSYRKSMLGRSKLPAQCTLCMQAMFTHKIFQADDLREIIGQNIANMDENYRIKDYRIGYLFVNFDNCCNLSCRTCSTVYSTTYGHKILSIINPDEARSIEGKIRKVEEDILEKILETNTPVCLEVQGGEPFLSVRFGHFVGRFKGKRIRLITNGMVYNETWLNNLNRIQDVTLWISMDGPEKVNDYIRIGSKLQEVKTNIIKIKEKFKNFKLRINHTISLYNIRYLVEMLNEITGMEEYIDGFDFHFVENINAMKITSLSPGEKEEITRLFSRSNLKKGRSTDECKKVLAYVVDYMNHLDTYDPAERKAFVDFNNTIDKYLHITSDMRSYSVPFYREPGEKK